VRTPQISCLHHLLRLLERSGLPQSTRHDSGYHGLFCECQTFDYYIIDFSCIFLFFYKLVLSHFSPPSILTELPERLEHFQRTSYDLWYLGLFCESATCDFGGRGRDSSESGFLLNLSCCNRR